MGGFFAVSLGGNLRTTRRAFGWALGALLSNRNLFFTGCSPVSRTDPWEVVAPAFLNQVVTGYSRIGAPGLWNLLIQAERLEIRRGKGRLHPRTLDLDFLLFSGAPSPRRDLILPHPRLADRPVLQDLLHRSETAPRSRLLWVVQRSVRAWNSRKRGPVKKRRECVCRAGSGSISQH